jgi:hypothetical protein
MIKLTDNFRQKSRYRPATTIPDFILVRKCQKNLQITKGIIRSHQSKKDKQQNGRPKRTKVDNQSRKSKKDRKHKTDNEKEPTIN